MLNRVRQWAAASLGGSTGLPTDGWRPADSRRGRRLKALGLAIAVAIVTLLGVRCVSAQLTDATVAVPPELQPWIPWVLDEHKDAQCLVLGSQRQCYWPGELALDVERSRVRFLLRVVVDATSVVPLPGSAEYWPEQVRVGRRLAVTMDSGQGPAIELGPGSHEITGEIVWTSPPESLPVPVEIARVSLRREGGRPSFPSRTRNGRLWLGPDAQAAAAEEERTEIDVSRRLRDGTPFIVDTRIVLRVSGRVRALDLGRALLPGSRPSNMTSDLPVTLDEDGDLVAQIWPGTHEIMVAALLPRPPERLTRPRCKRPWPAQEIWAWDPAPTVRLARPVGLAGIDPERTNVPAEWRNLSTFVAAEDSVLELTTLQRGQPTVPTNELSLDRTLWIDEDGTGFTARDELTGALHSGWRLNLETGELGHVYRGPASHLITTDPSGHRGVELRDTAMALGAEWRSTDSVWGPLPIAGWSESLRESRVTLRLPPGWRFLGAWGADRVLVPDREQPGSWYLFDTYQMGDNDWGLLGYLFVVLAAVATGRLLGWPWGVVALVALGLSREYELAPYAGWGVMLALLALLRRADGRVQRGVAGVFAMAAMLGVTSYAVEFVALRLATVLSPNDRIEQYLHQGPVRAFGAVGGESIRREKAEDAYQGPPEQEHRVATFTQYLDSAAEREVDAKEPKDSPRSKPEELDTEAVVQTGPGVPDRFGSTRTLMWDGPVAKHATFRVLVLNRWQNALLGLVHAAAIVALGIALWRGLWRASVGRKPTVPSAGSPSPSASDGTDASSDAANERHDLAAIGQSRASVLEALLVLGALGGALTTAQSARAEVPRSSVLTDLEQRLTRGGCSGSCLVVPTLNLDVRDRALALDLEVHASQAAALPLPGPASSWIPRTVTVDGIPSQALVVGTDGHLALRLAKGRHRVVLQGPLASAELTMTLGTPVRRVLVRAEGWVVEGVREGHCDGTLALTRKEGPSDSATTETTGTATPAHTALPPWLQIERTIHVGVTRTVSTVVKRISQDHEPLAIHFPLLPGERIVDSTLTTTPGTVLLSLRRDQDELSFESTLELTEELVLVAPQGKPWSEAWTLDCGTIWHCEPSGFAPTTHEQQGTFRPLFQPWPGEQLRVRFTRPPAAGGVSMTIHEAQLSVPGPPEPACLSLDVATSTGGALPLHLPASAEITSVTVDDSVEPLLSSDGTPRIVLKPGRHRVQTRFRMAPERGLLRRTPRVSVGAAVNATSSIAIPEEQVALFVGGSGDRHSVVLWWGILALLVGAAFALSFLPASPLKRWQWVGLVLGFTQVHWMWLLPVVGWLLLVGWRDRWLGPARWWKSPVQLGIAAAMLGAAWALLKALHSVLVEVPHAFPLAVMNSGWVGSAMDRVAPDAALPECWLLTAPLWLWRLLHLVWALWLALLAWKTGRFAWAAFTRDGIWGPWPRWRTSKVRRAYPVPPDTHPT